ncbi:DUF5956 family protein [Amnibacterium kyonggiense]|uniref:Uncharacterized protein n=1 Tax=Amnibacterium kyonggiense TaxID=595671 RepID=A0A4R7FTB4_9MICO|nr:DUF5956 family protein [Amnibacterium kyonggiense]TDS81110.1 hypothetical protein CLV52_1686 [Amnibacterium kyonggiense]
MYEIQRTSWSEAVLLDDVRGWVPLEETGFDSAIAWAVPPGCLGYRPVDDTGRVVEFYDEQPDGAQHWQSRPFAAEDRQKVEDLANWYLGEAGIPPQPPSVQWFIKESVAFGPDTARQIMGAIFERKGSDPERILDDLIAVIPKVYG